MRRPPTSVGAVALWGALAVVGCGGSTLPVPDGAAAGPRFVAVGAAGTILGSPDGFTWKQEPSPVRESLASVAAGRSGFVAVGAEGTIVTSPDGVSWTRRDAQTTAALRHVVFDGETFIAVGESWTLASAAVTLKSRDGLVWTHLTSPSSYMFHAVAHGKNGLVAAAYYRSDLQTPALFTTSAGSADPAGWIQRTGPDFYDSLLSGDRMVVVGGRSVSTSEDGLSWQQQQVSERALLTGLSRGGATFVVVGELGTVHTSTDATRWTRVGGIPAEVSLRRVAYGGASFVAVGAQGAILTSPDGATWTRQAAPTSQALSDIAHGPLGP